MTKFSIQTVITLTAAFLLLLPSWSFAEQGIADGLTELTDVELRLEPTFVIERAEHVANGVALRNRIEGTIHLRGIPNGAIVLRAWVYFTILDNQEKGDASYGLVFNGNLVSGTLVADSEDPCWALVGAHTYRAGVVNLVRQALPNQDYEVTVVKRGLNTDGESPWSTASGDRLLEGATLVVIYRTDNSIGTVYIYDAFINTMFTASGTFTLLHANESGSAFFTMTGADGQRGTSGYANGDANETTTFNGTLIAGPGASAVGGLSAGDWDGNAGWPLPQLWDVQTHIVSVDGGSSTVVYKTNGDCLVPAAMVLDIQ